MTAAWPIGLHKRRWGGGGRESERDRERGKRVRRGGRESERERRVGDDTHNWTQEVEDGWVGR